MNKETLEPELENVMSNYLGCSQILFGKKVKYCVTYTTGQRAFDIHRQKYLHNFKVPVSSQNLEGAKAMELTTMNQFLVSNIDSISIYDSQTF